MKDLGIPVPGPADPLPSEPLLQRLPGAGLVLSDLGTETRDGTDDRHYQGGTPDPVNAVAGSPAPSPSGSPSRSASAAPIDPAEFRAALDLWVDAGDGHLVASDVHLVAALTVPGTSLVAEYTVHESVTIGGVADPDGAVRKPSLDAVGYGITEGADPSLAPMVRAAFAALGTLDSYRVAVSFLGDA